MKLLTVNISEPIKDDEPQKNFHCDDVWDIISLAAHDIDTVSKTVYCSRCKSKHPVRIIKNRAVCDECGKTIPFYRIALVNKVTHQRIIISQGDFEKICSLSEDNFPTAEYYTPSMLLIGHKMRGKVSLSIIDESDYGIDDHPGCILDRKRMSITLVPDIEFEKETRKDIITDRTVLDDFLMTVNINLNDFKILTYKTFEHAITINTYNRRDKAGLTMSCPSLKIEEGQPIFETVLKDKKGNISVYTIVKDLSGDEYVFTLKKNPIKNKKNLNYYRRLDEGFKYNGARLKIKLYPGDQYDRVITPDLCFINTNKPELYQKICDCIGEDKTSFIGIIRIDPDEPSIAERIQNAVEIRNSHQKTRHNYIGISGFTIPKSELRKLHIPYIISIDTNSENQKPFSTIRSN